MRFGAHYLPTYVPELDGPPQELYRRMFEQMEALDRLGYDYAWVTEHHFHEYGGMIPDPATFLSAVACHTSRIRLGIAIVVLPLHNPLQVAESYAMVDVTLQRPSGVRGRARVHGRGIHRFRHDPGRQLAADERGYGGHPASLVRGERYLPRPGVPGGRRAGPSPAGAMAAPTGMGGREPQRRHLSLRSWPSKTFPSSPGRSFRRSGCLCSPPP